MAHYYGERYGATSTEVQMRGGAPETDVERTAAEFRRYCSEMLGIFSAPQGVGGGTVAALEGIQRELAEIRRVLVALKRMQGDGE